MVGARPAAFLDVDQYGARGSQLGCLRFAPDGVSGLYKFLDQIASQYMTRDVRAVARNVTVGELGERFEREDFNAYPVVDDGQVVGIVSKFDYLSCFVFTPASMIPNYSDLMRLTAGDVMTSEFIYVGPETRLTRVLELMINHRLRSVPVLGADQLLVGMISRDDVMRAVQHCAAPETQ